MDELRLFSKVNTLSLAVVKYGLCTFIPTADVDWGFVRYELTKYFVNKKGDDEPLRFFDGGILYEGMEKPVIGGRYYEYYWRLEKGDAYLYQRTFLPPSPSCTLIVRTNLARSAEEVFALVVHLRLGVCDVVMNDSSGNISVVFNNMDDLNVAKQIMEEMLVGVLDIVKEDEESL
jgi:hypothetical protein